MGAPIRPWWRADADAPDSDKLMGLPSDAARWAWFKMCCRAKTRRHMGVFPNEAVMRDLLGSHGRWVPHLIAARTVHAWPTDCERCVEDYADVASEGCLVVHDFLRKQVDPTNAERQARWRERNGGSGGSRNEERNDFSRALSQSPSLSRSESPPGAVYQVARTPADDVWRIVQTVEELVGMFGWSRGSPVFETLASDVAAMGPDRVEAAYRALRAEFGRAPMDAAQLIYGAHKRMFPIPGAGRSTPKGLQPDVDEVRRAFEN